MSGSILTTAAHRAVARAFVELQRLGATVDVDVHVRVGYPPHLRRHEDQRTAYRACAALGRLEGMGVLQSMVDRRGRRAGWHTLVTSTPHVVEAMDQHRDKLRRQGLWPRGDR